MKEFVFLMKLANILNVKRNVFPYMPDTGELMFLRKSLLTIYLSIEWHHKKFVTKMSVKLFTCASELPNTRLNHAIRHNQKSSSFSFPVLPLYCKLKK